MIRQAHHAVRCFLGLVMAGAALGENPVPDSQLTLAMLAEVRQLRQELQVAAVNVQRVQIVMFRLQVQGKVLESAKQRLEQARNSCNFVPREREMVQSEIEDAETNKRSAQNASDQKAADARVSRLNVRLSELATQERECQAQLIELEAQSRNEDAKMTELQDQLQRLDRVLLDSGRK